MLNFHLCRIRVNSSPYVVLRHPGIPLANEMALCNKSQKRLKKISRMSQKLTGECLSETKSLLTFYRWLGGMANPALQSATV